ncbi:Uncharacterised protein [Dorea longicatena]|nr:Uncharacterised protein [Dorea longicatena]
MDLGGLKMQNFDEEHPHVIEKKSKLQIHWARKEHLQQRISR